MTYVGIFKIHSLEEEFFYLLVYICLWVCEFFFVLHLVTKRKNDRDLKFGKRTSLDHIQNRFIFFEKVTLRAVSLEKSLSSVDFPHIVF